MIVLCPARACQIDVVTADRIPPMCTCSHPTRYLHFDRQSAICPGSSATDTPIRQPSNWWAIDIASSSDSGLP